MKKLISVIFSCFLVASCNSDPDCFNDVLIRSDSPDRKYSAALFSRQCGATVGENYQVSVAPFGKISNVEGNVLIVDGVDNYGSESSLHWESDNLITVTVPKGARVFKKKYQVGGVRVIFKEG